MSARLLLLLVALAAVPAWTQDVPPATGEAPAAADPSGAPADDEVDPADPDFSVVALPTAVRVADGGVVFRLTHRFGRPLGQGDLSDLASDLFGFDSGAQVGIELRYGLRPGLQLGVHRTSDKTIQLFGLYDVRHAATNPVGIAVLGTVEGLDNFGLSTADGADAQFSPGAAVIVSRRLGTRGTLYAIPTFVANTNVDDPTTDDDGALYLGLGARLRLGESWSLLAEFAPRLAGYEPVNPVTREKGRHHIAFGIERRVGGHAFQLNVQDSLGTTPGQIARGGTSGNDWFIGFNLSRRFF
jgi:hypothetical protein